MNPALAPIRDAKTILLTTYKRDGTPVATPVSVAFDGERAFFRSYDTAWKTRLVPQDDRPADRSRDVAADPHVQRQAGAAQPCAQLPAPQEARQPARAR